MKKAIAFISVVVSIIVVYISINSYEISLFLYGLLIFALVYKIVSVASKLKYTGGK